MLLGDFKPLMPLMGHTIFLPFSVPRSPSNERVRSRVELSKVLADTLDMTMFDYKAGVFRGVGQPKPLRARKTVIIKKKKLPVST